MDLFGDVIHLLSMSQNLNMFQADESRGQKTAAYHGATKEAAKGK